MIEITAANYDEALARVEQLMDAEVDTPEAEELEALSRALEAYERVAYPEFWE